MTTNLSEPAVQNAGDVVEEKVKKATAVAKKSFANREFSATVRVIEQVPEGHRTDELKQLLEQSKEIEFSETQLESARRSIQSGNHEQAIRLLEQIPEADRNADCKKLLKNTRNLIEMVPILKEAKKSLKAYDYSKVVRILEAVSKPDRSDEVIELLREAHSNLLKLKELRSEVDKKFVLAVENCSSRMYAEALPLLEQILEIQPGDEDAPRKIEDANRYIKHFEKRDRLYKSAVARVEDRDYRSAIELLTKVPEDLRKGEVEKLLSEAEACERQIQELTNQVLENIRTEEYSGIYDLIRRLDDLQSDSVRKTVTSLGKAGHDEFLISLCETCGDDNTFLTLLDLFLDDLTLEELVDFLLKAEDSFVKRYPGGGKALPTKLGQLLDQLADRPERFDLHLQVLHASRPHLGDDAARLDAWERFLVVLDEFDALQRHPWTLKETLIENAKAAELEQSAKQLAETADCILPAGNDPWSRLQLIADGRLSSNAKIAQRVYARITDYLRTSEWSPRPITPITLRRIGVTVLGLIAVVMVGSIAQVLMSAFFNVGGMAGYVLTGFLATLWTSFYVAANKIL